MSQTSDPITPLKAESIKALGKLLLGLGKLEELLKLPNFPSENSRGLELGRYRLMSKLGDGRFAHVFLADDPALQRRVAIKIPQAFVLSDRTALARFIHEGQLAARLDHPGIVPLLEVGELDGLPFLVTEYVPGKNLEAFFEERLSPLPHLEAATCVRDMARAIAHAHNRGMLHLDLTPRNVLILNTPTEVFARITDFGLARNMLDGSILSSSQALMGQPLYMAPEQARGDRGNLTVRSDVYSLGAILHWLLTGTTTIKADTLAEAYAVLLDAKMPPKDALSHLIPRDLRAITRKALAYHPEDRYATAQELAEDLDNFLNGKPVNASPRSWRDPLRWIQRNFKLVAVGGIFLLALLTVVGFVVTRWFTQREDASKLLVAEAENRAMEALLTAEKIRTEKAEAATREAITRLTYADAIRQILELPVRRESRAPDWPRLNLESIRKLAALGLSEEVQQDLRTEATLALSVLQVGEPQIVAHLMKPYTLTFSPDGKHLAIGAWLNDKLGFTYVRVYDVATAKRVHDFKIAIDQDWKKRNGKEQSDGVRSLTYSPDGRWLVAGIQSGWIVRWDLHDVQPQSVYLCNHTYQEKLPQNAVIVEQLKFSPDGQLLIAVNGTHVKFWKMGSAWQLVHTMPRRTSESTRIIDCAYSGELLLKQERTLLRVLPRWPWVMPVSQAGPLPEVCHLRIQPDLFLGQNSSDTLASFFNTNLVPGTPNQVAMPTNSAPLRSAELESSTLPNGIAQAFVRPGGTEVSTSNAVDVAFKIWDSVAGRELFRFNVMESTRQHAYAADGNSLALCESVSVRIYPLASSPILSYRYLSPTSLFDYCRTPRTAYTLGITDPIDRRISVAKFGLPQNTRFPEFTQLVHRDNINERSQQNVMASPNGQHFVCRGVWDFYHSPTQGIRKLPGFVGALAILDNGELWNAHEDLTVFDEQLKQLEKLPYHYRRVKTAEGFCSVIATNFGVFAGTFDGVVCKFDPQTRKEIKHFNCLPGRIQALSLSMDGNLLAVGDDQGNYAVISLPEGQRMTFNRKSHESTVMALAINNHGWVATCSREQQLKLWTPTGEMALMIPFPRLVRRMNWSNDGQQLEVLIDGERGVRVYKIKELRQELAKLGLDLKLPSGNAAK